MCYSILYTYVLDNFPYVLQNYDVCSTTSFYRGPVFPVLLRSPFFVPGGGMGPTGQVLREYDPIWQLLDVGRWHFFSGLILFSCLNCVNHL